MPTSDVAGRLRQLVVEVMEVESIILDGERDETLRAVGRLREPAHEVFARLRPLFEEVGHTPFLRRQDGRDVIVAVHRVFKPEAISPWPNVALFLVTVVSVLFVGTTNDISSLPITLDKLLASLPTGLLFTASMLGILGAHEMGHYLMARRHGVRVTLPYFIPLPTLLGTMGAIIAMRELPPNRRVQFDIGVAGPVAGLVVAVPVLVVGLLLSHVYTRQEIIEIIPNSDALLLEGNSLLYAGLKCAIFGKLLPTPAGEDVLLHTMAWAGWAGLLVTALNLMPVGQLDGGHVVYGLFGERARLLALPVAVALLALSLLYQGWLLWVALTIILTLRRTLVFDEITVLDKRRRRLAIAMLIVFVLIFVPVPLKTIPLP